VPCRSALHDSWFFFFYGFVSPGFKTSEGESVTSMRSDRRRIEQKQSATIGHGAHGPTDKSYVQSTTSPLSYSLLRPGTASACFPLQRRNPSARACNAVATYRQLAIRSPRNIPTPRATSFACANSTAAARQFHRHPRAATGANPASLIRPGPDRLLLHNLTFAAACRPQLRHLPYQRPFRMRRNIEAKCRRAA